MGSKRERSPAGGDRRGAHREEHGRGREFDALGRVPRRQLRKPPRHALPREPGKPKLH